MKIKIHDNVIVGGIEYTVLSCDEFPPTNNITNKTINWAELLEKPPADSLIYICIWKKEDLFWEYVKDHNDNAIVIFNYGTSDFFHVMIPDGWDGGFSPAGPGDLLDNFRKFKKQQPRAGIYIVPNKYFSVSLSEVKTDDDSSYTQGYRDGCTGLRWL